MKVDGRKLDLDRVEVKRTAYDSHNKIVKEEWEFWYPPEKASKDIGYKLKR